MTTHNPSNTCIPLTQPRYVHSHVLPVLAIPWSTNAEARLQAMGLVSHFLEDIPQLVVLLQTNDLLGGYSATSRASLISTLLLLLHGLSKRTVALLLSTVGEARERRSTTIVSPPRLEQNDEDTSDDADQSGKQDHLEVALMMEGQAVEGRLMERSGTTTHGGDGDVGGIDTEVINPLFEDGGDEGTRRATKP